MEEKLSYTLKLRKKVGHDPIFMPAAGCGIIQNNQILLQKRTDNGTWALHGGALELGETFLEAVKREVFEELGIQVINPIFIKTYSGENMHFFYPNKDEVYVVASFYLVTDYIGEFHIDPKEVAEIKWFAIDDLPTNLNKPDIEGINDIITYYKKNYN
ncbi:MAG: NUDIX domain-containing protein [Bacilli bacterium]|nr:NUDIX domain-containing protein [Bacilli bacterium]